MAGGFLGVKEGAERWELPKHSAGASLLPMMSKPSIYINALRKEHAGAIKSFTDEWIGCNYYSIAEVEELLEASTINGQCSSFGAWAEDQLVAIRLTLIQGRWHKIIKRGLSPNRWPCAEGEMAYFKSLFVASDYQAKGLGRQLSERSLEALRSMGSKAVLCHSWLESPENSSQRYLKKLGFKEVAQHENFWFPIDYECTRCAPERCICTAAEMVLKL